VPGRNEISAQRRRQVARVATRLRDAMAREPLLLRLPPESQLASVLNVPLRVVRYALARLADDGWVEATGSGYRVIRVSDALKEPPQEVVLVRCLQAAGSVFSEFVGSGAASRCGELGWAFHTRWVNTDSIDAELAQLVQEMPGRHIGWASLEPVGAELLREWRIDRRRSVLIGKIHPEIATPSVTLDLGGAMRRAVDHLRGLGHRRIASVSAAPDAHRGLLAAGGMDARETAWITDVDIPMTYESPAPFAVQWTKRWLGNRDRPTAVVCHDYTRSLLLLDACQRSGIKVPEQLSIVAAGAAYTGEDEYLPVVTHAVSGLARELGVVGINLLQPEGQRNNSLVLLPTTMRDPGLTTGPPAEG